MTTHFNDKGQFSEYLPLIVKILLAFVFFSAIALFMFWGPFVKYVGSIQWDAVGVHFQNLFFSSSVWHAGKLPLWSPNLFNGFPQIADPQVAVFYPINLLIGLFFVFTPKFIMAQTMIHYVLAGLFAGALIYYFCKNYFFSLAAGAAYAFGGFMVGHASHLGMQNAAALLPLLLLLTILGLRQNKFFLAPAAGLTLALIILAGHLQMALYCAFAVGLFYIYECLRAFLSGDSRQKKMAVISRIIIFALVVYTLALGISAVQLLPTRELIGLSGRATLSLADSQTESLRPSALWGLWNFNYNHVAKGGYSGPWDRTQNYLFIGRLMLLLGVAGIFLELIRKGRRFRALAGFSFVFLAIGYALGRFSFIQPLFYSLVPLFNKVRAPANIFPLATLVILIFAGILIRRLTDSFSKNYGWRPAIFGIFVLIVSCMEILPKLHHNDLLYSSARWDQITGPSPIAQLVLNEYANHNNLNRFRVFRIASANDNSSQYLGINNFEGYNPLILQRQIDYTEAMIDNPVLVDLAGIKYLPCQYIQGRPELSRVLDYCLNDKYLPRAFLVNDVITASSPQSALRQVTSIEPSVSAVVESSVPIYLNTGIQANGVNEVTYLDSDNNSWHLKTGAANEALLVLTQTYYPGWQATVDGGAVELLRTDYLFQGIIVPAGVHDVKFQFESPATERGLLITLLSLAAAGFLFFRLIHQEKSGERDAIF